MLNATSKARKEGNGIESLSAALRHIANTIISTSLGAFLTHSRTRGPTSFSYLPMLKPRSFRFLEQTRDRYIYQSSIFGPVQTPGLHPPNTPLFSKRQRFCAYLTEGRRASLGELEIASLRERRGHAAGDEEEMEEEEDPRAEDPRR